MKRFSFFRLYGCCGIVWIGILFGGVLPFAWAISPSQAPSKTEARVGEQVFSSQAFSKAFQADLEEAASNHDVKKGKLAKIDNSEASAQQPSELILGNPHPQPPKMDGLSLGPEKPFAGNPEKEEPIKQTVPSKNGTSIKSRPSSKFQKNGQDEKTKGISESSAPLQPPPQAKSASRHQLGPEWKTLAEQIRQTVQSAWQLPLNTRDHTPAEMMLWALLWGCNAEAAYGGPDAKKVNTLAILCHNYPCADRQLLVKHDGHFAARFGYGYQTHRGQFLALLAWARVPKDYPLQVGQEKRTVADLVEYEKLHCRSLVDRTSPNPPSAAITNDQSHVLLGLSFYLEKPEETSWQNNLGEPWSLERLISEVLAAPTDAAPDGGLHRLMALSYALYARRKYNLPWTPLFDQVQQYLQQYQKHAFRCQNEDGTWNSAFLEAIGPSQDRLGVLQSTGHIFRWLAFVSMEEELYDSRMFKSAQALLSLIHTGRYLQARRWSLQEFFALMYALDGLSLYQQRALTPLTEKTPP